MGYRKNYLLTTKEQSRHESHFIERSAEVAVLLATSLPVPNFRVGQSDHPIGHSFVWCHASTALAVIGPVSIFLMTLSITGLISLWYVALRIQRKVHGLFETSVIDRPAKNSPVDAVLSGASHMTEWGLFTASI